VEPVVVPVPLDVPDGRVVVARRDGEVPEPRGGRPRRIPRATEPRERDEGPIDREAGDGVVRAQVVRRALLRAGRDEGPDDPGLVHLPLQPLRGDVASLRRHGPLVGLQTGVDVDGAELVVQLQHRLRVSNPPTRLCRSGAGEFDSHAAAVVRSG